MEIPSIQVRVKKGLSFVFWLEAYIYLFDCYVQKVFFSLEALSFDSLVTFFSHAVTAGPVFYVHFSIILLQNTLLETMSAEKKPTKHKAYIYSMWAGLPICVSTHTHISMSTWPICVSIHTYIRTGVSAYTCKCIHTCECWFRRWSNSSQ